jgi:hypothetical protein
MVFRLDDAGTLLWGTLLDRAGGLPFSIVSLLPDLRPRFLAKGQVGRGYRAVARNGRILLASDRNLAELAGQASRVRFQVWHRTILPGEPPRPYGLLVIVRQTGSTFRPEVLCESRLVEVGSARGELVLQVGGGTALEFVQPPR